MKGLLLLKMNIKIKIDDRYNYIDLLLYNIKYKCYVVVELKVTELKKEHTASVSFFSTRSISFLKKRSERI